MGCGCKGSSYEAPQVRSQTTKAAKVRKVTQIDQSYFHTRPQYNGPQPKQDKGT